MPAKTSTSAPKHRYMLIDGNALIHRGFHAIPPLTTKSGEPTNAVYGFTMILLRAIKDLKPTHIACAFDLKGPTFRHEKYADYKGTRVKAAQELYDQIPRVHDVVAALNIPIFEQKGFEADDVLGTLAHKICGHQNHDCDVMIVTGDLDTLQLVNDCVKIYTLRKGLTDIAIYDTKAVRQRYGLNPDQMVDFKALRGDPSDNIKGVKGIGETGAIDLIKEFGSIENLYKAIHSGKAEGKVKPRTLELLKADEDAARLSHELSVIKCDLDLDAKIPAYEFGNKDMSKTVKLFQELEFHSLISKLPKKPGEKVEAAVPAEIEDSKAVPLQKKGGEKYELVDDEKKLAALIGKLEKADEFAVDTETTSLDAIRAKLVGASFSTKAKLGWYVPAALVNSSPELKKILESAKHKKIGHNIKYDLLSLQNADINLSGLYFDTMLASSLLNAGSRQHGLDVLAFNELGYQMQPIEDLIGKGKKQITMDLVDPAKVAWYAAEDADMTLQLKQRFAPELKKQGLDKIFYDIEMPLMPVLAKMERAGIKLDVSLLELLANDVKKRLHAIEKSIYKLADGEFNLNSPIQMREVLFTKLGLVSPDNKKTKTGVSTAAAELEKMIGQHDIIPKILEYRELSKLQSTYILALPEMVNPDTGRIHTNYNQTIAATGRLSSIDPNLQNIPVRGEGVGAEIRKAFVAERGYELLSLDYSQIELRIVAHLSQDKNMLKIFKKDEDIHTNTASEVFGVAADKVTADMRRDAKTINFGVLYGLSAFGLTSRIAAVEYHSAKEFIDKYFAAYPGMKEYIDKIKDDVRRDGFVRNELGRMRKFPEIRASNFMVRAAAERQAVNFPIQSLAADVIKVAMINIGKQLAGKDDEIKMLLQVHDELVFEVKKDRVEHYAKLLKPLMEDAIKLSVPVGVEAKAGKSWGEMTKLHTA
jgi:DNA polymerase-1